MLARLLEPLAYVAICGSLIIGAYHAGKLKERQRIWSEIATKSASVRAAMSKLDADADEFEATLPTGIVQFAIVGVAYPAG